MTHGIKSLKSLLQKRLVGRQNQSLPDRRASVDSIAAFGNEYSSPYPHYVDLSGVKSAIFTAAPALFDIAALDACIIYIHGGAFVAGSAKSHSSICWSLHQATGWPVIVPEYSLAPEYSHPIAKTEITSMIGAVIGASSGSFSYALVGDSAGATLSLLCAVELKRQSRQLPESMVLISPLTDLLCNGDSFDTRKHLDPFITRDGLLTDIDSFIGSDGATAVSIMEEYADLSGLPPMLLQVGLHEVLLDDARAFARAAEAAGVSAQLEIWPDMVHVWHLFPDYLEQSTRAVENIALFLKR